MSCLRMSCSAAGAASSLITNGTNEGANDVNYTFLPFVLWVQFGSFVIRLLPFVPLAQFALFVIP